MQTRLSAAPVHTAVLALSLLQRSNTPATEHSVQPDIVARPDAIVQAVVRGWASQRNATISLMPGSVCTVDMAPKHFRALLRGVLQAVFEGPAEWLDIEMTCRKGLYLIEICGPSAARQQKSTTFFGRKMRFLDDRPASDPYPVSSATRFSQRTQQFAPAMEANPTARIPEGLRRLAARYGGVVQCAAWNGLTVRIALPLV